MIFIKISRLENRAHLLTIIHTVAQWHNIEDILGSVENQEKVAGTCHPVYGIYGILQHLGQDCSKLSPELNKLCLCLL